MTTRRALNAWTEELNARPITLFAFGKAAAGMTHAARQIIEPRDGIVIGPSDEAIGALWTRRGGHPFPAGDALEVGLEVLRMADSLGAGDTALVLISGGASAMLELPSEGHTLATIRARTEAMMNAGQPIASLNAAREAMSRFKGGGLTRALRPARVLVCVISDVPGHPAALVGSDPARGADEFVVAASPITALEGAIAAAARRGLRLEPLGRVIHGEARIEGPRFAREAHELASERGVDGCVACGETTVTVRGNGRGGRNQEAALACLIEGWPQGELVMLATDGVDGASDSAGAHLDAALATRARGLSLGAYLANNDSFTILDELGATLRWGPTGTNVADLWIYLHAERPSR